MAVSRFLGGLVPAALVLLGCSDVQVRPDGGWTSDASAPMGVIELESEPSLALTFGEEAELAVRYTEAGVPVSGVPIRFALEGRAHDTTVADLSVDTDGEGRARTRVVAGTTSSAFRVRVSAERAAPLYVNVSVGNMGFGSLVAEAAYDGARAGVVRRVVDVYSSMGCDDELPPFPDTPVTLEDPSVLEARIRVLPAGLSYAVFGRVEGPRGVVLARACIDGVQVLRDEETRVVLEFVDEPLSAQGDYGAVLALTPTSSSAWVTELASTAGTAWIDAAGGAAGLYLDALDDELRARGLDAAADVLATERLGGVPDATLATQLDMAGQDPGSALAARIAALRARITAVALSGPLSIERALVATWEPSELAVGPSDPDTPALAIEPSAAGLGLSASVTLAAGTGDELSLEALVLSLPLGTLARSTLEAEVSSRGLASAGELLAPSAGCDALSEWIADSPTMGVACTEDCPQAVCVRALDGVMDAVLTAVDAGDAARDTVEVTGSITMRDNDGDLVADALDAVELSGSWSGPAESDPITAGLTAERSPE